MKTPANKTCLIGPALMPEQFIAQHLFFYLNKGTMSGYYGGRNYTLHSGEYGIARKNRLSRQSHKKEDEKTEKTVFVLDEPFLKTVQKKLRITATQFNNEESFLPLPENTLITNFMHSLIPYYNENGQLDKSFFDVKREELLLILLKLQPELAGLFFDYGTPEKIDLEEFMNRNYRFNVSVQRFAYMTGRSISAFKRDFKSIFNETPSHWLVKKRLEDAYYLIAKHNQKPSDIYLDLGFEALSHFSYAFKKHFGVTPTNVATQSNQQV